MLGVLYNFKTWCLVCQADIRMTSGGHQNDIGWCQTDVRLTSGFLLGLQTSILDNFMVWYGSIEVCKQIKTKYIPGYRVSIGITEYVFLKRYWLYLPESCCHFFSLCYVREAENLCFSASYNCCLVIACLSWNFKRKWNLLSHALSHWSNSSKSICTTCINILLMIVVFR